jgi:hypothetical protein
MSAVREYLKGHHLFTMKAFLSTEEDPDQKVWFHFDEEGKVSSHSFEPAGKEWDGSGPRPVITPMGHLESEAKMTENWSDFIAMAEEEESKQLG